MTAERAAAALPRAGPSASPAQAAVEPVPAEEPAFVVRLLAGAAPSRLPVADRCLRPPVADRSLRATVFARAFRPGLFTSA